MDIYWGDIHNHCGITYGFGSLDNALKAACLQLDFCAITGHAMWPDMPERNKETDFLVEFHTKGFSKLKKHWEEVRNTIAKANVDNEFVTFQSYEIHSSEFGDHHIVSPSDDLPLIESDSPEDLLANLFPLPAIAIPHHVGYTPGYRGKNWSAFNPISSPIVEVMSKHGCGMSDGAPYNYYHTMGPRDSRTSVFAGLESGCKFGFVGSTDHHAGYPGSYGDGAVAVVASAKTREAIWDGIINRRTYAVTGDKIKCNFNINGYPLGSEIEYTKMREIYLEVEACDYIDKILLYKNLKPFKIINGEFISSDKEPEKYKIRIENGWGDNDVSYHWQNEIFVEGGKILDLEPCFRGRNVLAPTPDMKENMNINKLANKIVKMEDNYASWCCDTVKNISTLHPQTNSVIYEIDGDKDTRVSIISNGKTITATIGELLEGSRTMHMKDFSSQAVMIHRAVPDTHYIFKEKWEDKSKDLNTDFYHAEIRQTNGQCAWISPIFIG